MTLPFPSPRRPQKEDFHRVTSGESLRSSPRLKCPDARIFTSSARLSDPANHLPSKMSFDSPPSPSLLLATPIMPRSLHERISPVIDASPFHRNAVSGPSSRSSSSSSQPARPSTSTSSSALVDSPSGPPPPRKPQPQKQPDLFKDCAIFDYRTFDPSFTPQLILANTHELANEWLRKLKK